MQCVYFENDNLWFITMSGAKFDFKGRFFFKKSRNNMWPWTLTKQYFSKSRFIRFFHRLYSRVFVFFLPSEVWQSRCVQLGFTILRIDFVFCFKLFILGNLLIYLLKTFLCIVTVVSVPPIFRTVSVQDNFIDFVI